MSRVLLLGESPTRTNHEARRPPLAGRSARVLATLSAPAGSGRAEGLGAELASARRAVIDGHHSDTWTALLHARFDCLNVMATPVDRWSAPRARAEARAIVELHQPAVVVCLGRKVQRAVGDALDHAGARLHARTTGNPVGWGGGLFGSWGVWSSPWVIEPTIVRRACTVCGASPPHRDAREHPPCPGHSSGVHMYADVRERRYAPWLASIPHPSGLNRLLNDPAVRDAARRTLRQAIHLAERPEDHQDILAR